MTTTALYVYFVLAKKVLKILIKKLFAVLSPTALRIVAFALEDFHLIFNLNFRSI